MSQHRYTKRNRRYVKSLDVKYSISEVNNTLDGIKSRLDTGEENFSELDNLETELRKKKHKENVQ